MGTMHWVVLADEAKARIFGADAVLDDLVEIRDLIHPEGRMSGRELKSDRAGRFSKWGGARTAADPRTEVEVVEATRFAAEVADVLRVGRNAGEYERIILVAPPKFLGRLRAALDPNVSRVVVGAIDKDLSGVPLDDLSDAIRRDLPLTAGMH